jgi:hypothetical protein
MSIKIVKILVIIINLNLVFRDYNSMKSDQSLLLNRDFEQSDHVGEQKPEK